MKLQWANTEIRYISNDHCLLWVEDQTYVNDEVLLLSRIRSSDVLGVELLGSAIHVSSEVALLSLENMRR